MRRDIPARALCLQQEETGYAVDRWNSLWPLCDLSSPGSSRSRGSVGNLPDRIENRRLTPRNIRAAKTSVVSILTDIAENHLPPGGTPSLEA